LVALGKIGVEIILAGEARMLVHGAIESEGGEGGHFDDSLVQYEQRAGKAEADRADIAVRRVTEARGAGAEDFGVGEELDVDFQSDHRFVFGEHVGSGSHRF